MSSSFCCLECSFNSNHVVDEDNFSIFTLLGEVFPSSFYIRSLYLDMERRRHKDGRGAERVECGSGEKMVGDCISSCSWDGVISFGYTATLHSVPSLKWTGRGGTWLLPYLSQGRGLVHRPFAGLSTRARSVTTAVLKTRRKECFRDTWAVKMSQVAAHRQAACYLSSESLGPYANELIVFPWRFSHSFDSGHRSQGSAL